MRTLRDALEAHSLALTLYGCGYHAVTNTTMEAVEAARARLAAVVAAMAAESQEATQQ